MRRMRPPGLGHSPGYAGKAEPAEVILLGSRAVGEHRHDSDVDLMVVAPDEAEVKEADEALRHLLEGKYEPPVVNVSTSPGGVPAHGAAGPVWGYSGEGN